MKLYFHEKYPAFASIIPYIIIKSIFYIIFTFTTFLFYTFLINFLCLCYTKLCLIFKF